MRLGSLYSQLTVARVKKEGASNSLYNNDNVTRVVLVASPNCQLFNGTDNRLCLTTVPGPVLQPIYLGFS